MSWRWSRCALVLPLFAVSCLGNGPGAAVANAALATGYAAHERANGRGCWGSCQAGTVCNEANGMCEPIPCGGCRAGYTCQETPLGAQCVHPGAELMLAPDLTSAAPDAGAPDGRLPDGGLPLVDATGARDAGAE